jgi:tetratricopeptide (TPR) repeat protein
MLIVSFLASILVGAVPENALQAADKSAVIERFIASRRNESGAGGEQRDAILAAVRSAAKDPSRRQEAIATALRTLTPEFEQAHQRLAAEDAAGARRLLHPLTESSDPWLAAEARLSLARALMTEGRYEEALPVVDALIERSAGHTVRLGEAWFLKGKLQAGSLQRDQATASLRTFLRDFPDEPQRMQGEARATLADLEEAEADLLTDVHSRMTFSERRLLLADSGRDTQAAQNDVVALLDEMIEELEKKSASCKGCKGASSSSGGSGSGGTTPGLSSGTSEASQITERNAPRTPWVDLTERQKDPSVFNAAKSRVPVQYRGLIEQYYQSFGETGAR